MGLEGEFRAQVRRWEKSGRQFIVALRGWESVQAQGQSMRLPSQTAAGKKPAEQAVTAQEVCGMGRAADIAVFALMDYAINAIEHGFGCDWRKGSGCSKQSWGGLFNK